MRPIHSLNYQRDRGCRYTEQFGYGFVSESPGHIQCANSKDILFAKDGFVVLAAIKLRPMARLVGVVLFGCGPTKIVCAIVERISVVMRHLVVIGRLLAMKGFADHCVYRVVQKGPRWIAETDNVIGGVAVCLGLQKPSMVADVSAGLSQNDTIERPYASKARSFVIATPRYRAPFLFLCYGWISHFALLKRRGQGMTEGVNQPSFPTYDICQSGSITIMTTRP